MSIHIIKYILIILILWIILPGNAAMPIPVDNAENENPLSDTIFIGSEPNYPPYAIIDEDGNLTGFSVEIFKAAAQEVGINVAVKTGLWTVLINDLATGQVDALPIMARTPEREELFDFTFPYMSLKGAVFVRKGDHEIHTVDDLKGKEILVMKSDNAEGFVTRENITDKLFTTTTLQEAFTQLAEGNHDALLVQHLTGLFVIDELGITNIDALNLQVPGFRDDYCFAVREGNDTLLSLLNEGLSIIIANNTYRDIYLQWFGPPGDSKTNLIHLVKKILWVLIPLLGLFIVLWLILLRRKVQKRTSRLNEEIIRHQETLIALRKEQVESGQREKQIRVLLNSTAEGIYAIDTKGNCVLINKSALNMLGYSDQSDLLGKNMHNLIHHSKSDGKKFSFKECAMMKSIWEEKEIYSDNDLLWRSDGTSFPAEFYAYPVRQNGVVTGSVVTFWDISARKRAESELLEIKNRLEQEVNSRTAELQEKVEKLDRSQQAMLYMVEDLNQITKELKIERKKLEAANQELEAFTYSVSHDLRGPLRAINGYANFLIEDYAESIDAEGKRFLFVIKENAEKMDQLITDLLNLSRVTRINLNLLPTDMKKMAKAVLHEIRTEEEKKAFELIVGEMPEVICDSGLMKQVWYNLIDNALKYSSKSPVKRVETGAFIQEDEVIFFVKDSGAGFDARFKEKIFGVFQRLHKETEFEGTGVGLAVVQRIIARHKGKIWAESEPGKGAAFYFSIPKQPSFE